MQHHHWQYNKKTMYLSLLSLLVFRWCYFSVNELDIENPLTTVTSETLEQLSFIEVILNSGDYEYVIKFVHMLGYAIMRMI